SRTNYSMIIVLVIAVGSIWYIPAHTWTARSMDGVSGGGPSGRGLGSLTTTWGSMSGATLEEIVVDYASANDARNDFEVELKNGGTVIDRSNNVTADYQRAVKVFG